MKFKKFNDIENVTRGKFTAHILAHGLGGGTWRVTEKIHGANFSIWYDGTKMKVGKRSSFVTEGDNSFFNAETVRAENADGVKTLFRQLNLKECNIAPIDYIIIYGEIFGGSYPHKDVKKIQDAYKVQSPPFYSPQNLFYAFDIAYKPKGEETLKYVDDGVIGHLLDGAGIFRAQTLFEGTLNQCMDYNNKFNSTIPGLLGLPELEKNVCEGIVIRPNDARFLPSGSRVILKSKNDEFSESGGKHRPPKEPPKLTEEGQTFFDEACGLITENRLKNILSKTGPIMDKEFGKLLGMFMKDVIEEIQKDNAEAYYALDDAERKIIHKFLNGVGSALIRTNFLNIIDGEF